MSLFAWALLWQKILLDYFDFLLPSLKQSNCFHASATYSSKTLLDLFYSFDTKISPLAFTRWDFVAESFHRSWAKMKASISPKVPFFLMLFSKYLSQVALRKKMIFHSGYSSHWLHECQYSNHLLPDWFVLILQLFSTILLHSTFLD